jgi:pimeloyl-ACP methyl ester carboxylesterase
MEDFAADICRVLDALGAERAHIVGLSMGGFVAQDFYARHPERVRSLTLCDTSRGPRTEHSDEWVEEFLALRRKPLLEGKTPADIAPKVAETLMGSAATEATRARLVESLSALHAESYIKTLETVTRYHPILKLEEVAVPTLVIVGGDDRLTPPRASEVLAAAIPGARLEVLPGAGHLSNIEAPEAFNRLLEDFLHGL